MFNTTSRWITLSSFITLDIAFSNLVPAELTELAYNIEGEIDLFINEYKKEEEAVLPSVFTALIVTNEDNISQEILVSKSVRKMIVKLLKKELHKYKLSKERKTGFIK